MIKFFKFIYSLFFFNLEEYKVHFVTKTIALNVIEDIFSVKVVSINTSILSSKKRRLGKFLGYKNSFKRVLITLTPGQFIPFF